MLKPDWLEPVLLVYVTLLSLGQIKLSECVSLVQLSQTKNQNQDQQLRMLLKPDKTFDYPLIDRHIPESKTHLTQRDFLRAKTVARDQPKMDWSSAPIYNSRLFEGDIIGVSNRNISNILSPVKMVQFRTAHKTPFHLYDTGHIPYTISSQYSALARAVIASAFEDIERRTCVRFVPHSSETDYVHIEPREGCASSIGKTGGRQLLSIGAGCIVKGIIQHELMHVLGFFHEQSRSDRDEYVKIIYENVLPSMKDNFNKYDLASIDNLGSAYDYGSIMHYDSRAFSRNGLPTLEAIKSTDALIGQRIGLSAIDLAKINNLYACAARSITDQSIIGSIVDPSSSSSSLEQCQDQRDDCSFLYQLNFCGKFRSWTGIYCQKTCDQCTVQSEVWTRGSTLIPVLPLTSTTPTPSTNIELRRCFNLSASCQLWADNDLCTRAPCGRAYIQRCLYPRGKILE